MRKKTIIAVMAIAGFLFLLVGMPSLEGAKANPFVEFPRSPNSDQPIIAVESPLQKNTYTQTYVDLNFTVAKPTSWHWNGTSNLWIPPVYDEILQISYSLDGKNEVLFNTTLNYKGDGLPQTVAYNMHLENLAAGYHTLRLDVTAIHFYGGDYSMEQPVTPLYQTNTTSTSLSFIVADWIPYAITALIVVIAVVIALAVYFGKRKRS